SPRPSSRSTGPWGGRPDERARDRGAPRVPRGAPSVGGCGGPYRGPPRDRMTALPLDQILAGFMFAGMIAFLFLAFPVPFSLPFPGFLFGGFGIALGFLRPDFLNILPIRIWGTMTNFTLLAVPLFVFMGVALEKSGIAEELLETMALLFGHLR